MWDSNSVVESLPSEHETPGSLSSSRNIHQYSHEHLYCYLLLLSSVFCGNMSDKMCQELSGIVID